ncbi:MAG: RNA polymerase subunit sigma-24 [Propionibacteriales bacterium]|nr:RNA polymerase subunit sigma-24 [Propionibacteriales bacterium]
MEQALDRLLRDEWGRLLALLVARYRRLDLAEDGLADAFEAAARHWPADGLPDNPPAWLLTTARRRILDRLRAESVRATKLPLLEVDARVGEQAQRVMADGGDVLVDERLRLVLLCAHPRLSREAAAALTLRLVMGMPTEEIARLFLVPTATMAARLTRARKKLAGASFTIPAPAALAARVAVVADVAYLAFTAGYAPGTGADVLRPGPAGEAVRLVRVLRSVLPGDVDRSELDALLALMLFQHSRRDARVRTDQLVLLPDQDRTRWRHDEINEAVALLTPLTAAPPAPYLLQALVAAEHSIAATAADTAWDRIVARYDELLTLAPTPVTRLNRAVAVAERDGPAAGLKALEGVALPGHRLPAVRAELLIRSGLRAEALTSYDAAIALCRNEAERAHLQARRVEAG